MAHHPIGRVFIKSFPEFMMVVSVFVGDKDLYRLAN
jgi:hypothetical protein